MNRIILILAAALGISTLISCSNNATITPVANENTAQEIQKGQSAIQDESSSPNVVKIAVSSKDHTTLVKALQAASLVDVLANPGPFTVFAPTNEAFSKLPAGTLDELLKPEKKSDLQDILQYHVYVGVIDTGAVEEGRLLNMVNGGNVTLHRKDGKLMANEATIVASIRASNGIIHVVDAVLLPPAKK